MSARRLSAAALLLAALLGAPAAPAEAPPPAPSAFERWLAGDGLVAWPPAVEALRERLGAKGARVEGSFLHAADAGLRFDFVFAVRRPPAEAAATAAAVEALVRERAAGLAATPGAMTEAVEVERVPLDVGGQEELRVHFTGTLPAAPGADALDAAVARWKGLADPALLPTFLREALGPLAAVACDGIPGPCTYWTLSPAGDGDPLARARVVVAAARRHGFTYDAPETADPTDASVTGFQDCSGAALATRVWGGRLHVTLQMRGAGSGTRPVAECSREAGGKGQP
jgi:hypothetical protein